MTRNRFRNKTSCQFFCRQLYLEARALAVEGSDGKGALGGARVLLPVDETPGKHEDVACLEGLGVQLACTEEGIKQSIVFSRRPLQSSAMFPTAFLFETRIVLFNCYLILCLRREYSTPINDTEPFPLEQINQQSMLAVRAKRNLNETDSQRSGDSMEQIPNRACSPFDKSGGLTRAVHKAAVERA